MYDVFRAPRDPFGPICDDSLYWENTEREVARRRIVDLLLSGKGVWLSGPPGSGRTALLAQSARTILREGRRVLRAEPPPGCSTEEFLEELLAVTTVSAVGGGIQQRAEALYGSILAAFCEGGTVICFPGLERTTVGSLAEAAILSRFRVAGTPLVALALAGENGPPFAGLEQVCVQAPSSSDLHNLLTHRAEACGRSDLLEGDLLRTLASSSRGFGDALVRARRADARSSFLAPRRAAPNPPEDLSESSTASRPLFDPAEIDELGRLLASLSPGL